VRALLGREALEPLTQPRDIALKHPWGPGIPLGVDLPPELDRIPHPLGPAVVQIREIGIQATAAPILRTLGKRAGAGEPAHGGGAHAEGMGDPYLGHALLM
jgi:hypothetical protein